MGQRELTKRQQRVLDFIAQHVEEYGRPPTVREIGQRFHLRSTGSVRTHLEALEKKGFITRQQGISRGIMITHLPATHGQAGGRQGAASSRRLRRTRQIPVVGRVAAGPPILAVEDIEEIFELDEDLVPSRGEVFALRVTGDSMINVGIHNGDYVFVRRQQSADRGDIIVAIVDGEATVKIYQPMNGKVCLQPANDSLQPTIIDPAASDFMIVGKVTGMMRRF